MNYGQYVIFLLVATAETLFLATINTESITVSDDQVILFNSALINPGEHYSTETGGYTVPFSGYYQYVAFVRLQRSLTSHLDTVPQEVEQKTFKLYKAR